jgi:hypothetical protein
MYSMIETLISSKTRIKLLLKFFLNSKTTAYLRSLEAEFGDSTNAIRVELNKLENAGMLSSSLDGNKKIFQANTKHPLFKEIHNILLKQIGLDQIIETVVKRLGDVDRVYLIGDFAKGLDSQIIDLIFIGGDIDKNYLLGLVEKVEQLISRKLRYLLYKESELSKAALNKMNPERLLLWSKEE